MSVSAERIRRLRAAGLCIRCGIVPPADGIQRCRECNVKQLEALRRSRENRSEDAGTLTSYQQIAAELGITEAMVRTLASRAIRKLRRACRAMGISSADVMGRPASMTARLEDWA